MGTRQGIRRITGGITRTLTRHEIARGYVFLTKDTRLEEVLDTTDLTIHVLGKAYDHRKVDVSGRIHVPRSVLAEIGVDRALCIKLQSRRLVTIDLVTNG